jgi:P27 family predicted phage terminase small subunit
MRAGRKPSPTRLLKMRGSFNPTLHRDRKHEVIAVGDLAEPPTDLTDRQQALWRSAIDHAPRSVLKQIDTELLKAWCEAADRLNSARLMQARLDRGRRDVLLKGGTASPYLRIMDDAGKMMLRYASELGFTPSSRTRLYTDKPTIDAIVEDERPDPWKLLEVA